MLRDDDRKLKLNAGVILNHLGSCGYVAHGDSRVCLSSNVLFSGLEHYISIKKIAYMSGKSLGSSTFYNRKSSESVLKVINFQPHISLGFDGGDVNLYGYVFNNPTNYTDPTGKIAGVDDATIIALLGITATVAYLESPQGQAMLAQNTKQLERIIQGLLEHAQEHADKCNAAPPNDPDQRGWRKEIKAALDRARRLAEKRRNYPQEEGSGYVMA